MLIITPDSHLDHGLSAGHIRFILDRFRDRSGFFIETVLLPASVSDLECALRGPTVGTAPVPDDEVVMKPRNGRAWPSRLMRMGFEIMKKPDHVSWGPLYTDKLTVVAGPTGGENGDLPCVLYTAYGGPAAPREPGDPALVSPVDIIASKSFWAVHALVP